MEDRFKEDSVTIRFTIQVYDRLHLSKVINGVYAEHKAAPELAALFGEGVTVAYTNPPSIAKLLVRARA